MQRSLEVSLGCMLSASLNLPLIKLREAYWCYFSVFVFFFPPPPPLPVPVYTPAKPCLCTRVITSTY